MIDDLFPEGVPGGFLQLGNLYFVGCAVCGQPLAVAWPHFPRVVIERVHMFLEFVAALSGRLVNESDRPFIGGLEVVPYEEEGYFEVQIVYPVNEPPTRVQAAELWEQVHRHAQWAVQHHCGPLTSAA